MTESGLRSRKKLQTRQALVRAAYRLFDQRGYDQTTVTEIAAAANVSPGTLFNYFGSKEELLFIDREAVLATGLEALADRRTDEPLVQVVARAARRMLVVRTLDDDPGLETIRVRLIMTVPALRATMLQRLFDAQRRMAAQLRATYPREVRSELQAAAIVGAVIGAATAAVHLAIEQDRPLERTIQKALDHLVRADGLR